MRKRFPEHGIRLTDVRLTAILGVSACLVLGPLCAIGQSPDCRRGLDSQGAAVTGVGVGDFDGDGDFDILVSASRDATGAGVWPPVSGTRSFFPSPDSSAYFVTTRVSAARKPAKCVPPSRCGILLVKHSMFS